jgi:O-Antigen ligase
MSVSLILHALLFLVAGNYKAFWQRLIANKWLLLLLAFWCLHALSLFWSTDLNEGWDGLRVRISLVYLPLLYIGTLSFKQQQIITYTKVLMLAIVVVIGLNVVHYGVLIQNNLALDIRQLSWFGSHIRFGILVSFSGILAFYLWKKKFLPMLLLVAYLLLIGVYTLYSQTFSALISAAFVLLVIGYDFIQSSRFSRMIGIGFLCVIGVAGAIAIKVIATPNPTCGSFVSVEEANRAWALRSEFPLDSLDRKGQGLTRTAERYLCAKEVSLTATSIQKLSQEDVLNIENGFTSEYSANGGIWSRVEEVKFELHEAKDPNGHSLLQRIAYWKTAWAVINDHPWLGVGIGDINSEMENKYIETGSTLKPENRHRSHNMYLTTWMGVGVIGLLLLLWGIGYFGWIGLKEHHLVLLAFSLIVFSTMCLEDSLETQAGSSFVGFFIAILCGQHARTAWTTKNY